MKIVTRTTMIKSVLRHTVIRTQKKIAKEKGGKIGGLDNKSK